MIVLDTSVIIDLFIDGDAAAATDEIVERGEGAFPPSRSLNCSPACAIPAICVNGTI